MFMKSIKTKILVTVLPIVTITILLLNFFNFNGMISSTEFALETSMTATRSSSLLAIETQFEGYRQMAKQLAGDPVLLGEVTEGISYPEDIVIYLQYLSGMHGYSDVNVISPEGIVLDTGSDVSGREYFTEVRDTLQTYISDPIINAASKEFQYVIATPQINSAGEFIGVLTINISAAEMSNLLSNVLVGEGSTAYIVDGDNNLIAHNDMFLAEEGIKAIDQYENSDSISGLDEIYQDLEAGNSGFLSYTNGDSQKYAIYAPIAGISDWGLVIETNQSYFLSTLNTYILVFSIVGIAAILVIAIIIIILARRISTPIKLCAERLKKFSEGDVSSPIPKVTSKDEIKVLSTSMEHLSHNISTMIGDINMGLREMSEGNFNIGSAAEEYYVGDFESLKDYMVSLIIRMSSTLSQISNSAELVNIGSEQVAFGSQSLAQGATEQAASVQELSANIGEIANKVQQTAENTKNASIANERNKNELETSNKQMEDMISSMNAITLKSQEISKIIKTIDDIAFQTNILSLNAAVEAARAGSAGKGFAVVADEVRNLATKSAEAAKNTSELIAQTIQAVQKGATTAEVAAMSMSKIMDSAGELDMLVKEISQASEEQSVSLSQLNEGVQQISDVVQTNSATSEESAASSEELASQAQVLKALVAQFSLKTDEQPIQEVGEQEIIDF